VATDGTRTGKIGVAAASDNGDGQAPRPAIYVGRTSFRMDVEGVVTEPMGEMCTEPLVAPGAGAPRVGLSIMVGDEREPRQQRVAAAAAAVPLGVVQRFKVEGSAKASVSPRGQYKSLALMLASFSGGAILAIAVGLVGTVEKSPAWVSGPEPVSPVAAVASPPIVVLTQRATHVASGPRPSEERARSRGRSTSRARAMAAPIAKRSAPRASFQERGRPHKEHWVDPFAE
jgi:hypothetical protein